MVFKRKISYLRLGWIGVGLVLNLNLNTKTENLKGTILVGGRGSAEQFLIQQFKEKPFVS